MARNTMEDLGITVTTERDYNGGLSMLLRMDEDTIGAVDNFRAAVEQLSAAYRALPSGFQKMIRVDIEFTQRIGGDDHA